MKEWFASLPFRGKLYVIGLFSIFVIIPLSKDHVYLFSNLSIGILGVLGVLIFFDVLQFRNQSELSHLSKRLSVKEALGLLIIPAFYMWVLSIIFSIMMDFASTEKYKTLGNLDGYWYSGYITGPRFSGCHYYVRIKNDAGSNAFCVEHIMNHKNLKSAISNDVVLVGRSGMLGVVIDDIRLE